jgi:hypothetical protein
LRHFNEAAYTSHNPLYAKEELTLTSEKNDTLEASVEGTTRSIFEAAAFSC